MSDTPTIVQPATQSNGEIPDVFRAEPVQKRFSCDKCEKVFNSPQGLSAHQKAHLDKIPCEVCGGMYVPGTGMSRHKTTHERDVKTKRPKGACPQCARPIRKDNLRRHLITVHGFTAAQASAALGRTPMPTEPEKPEYTADDIFDSVVAILYPDGTMPVKSLVALLRWRDATTVMLSEIQ